MEMVSQYIFLKQHVKMFDNCVFFGIIYNSEQCYIWEASVLMFIMTTQRLYVNTCNHTYLNANETAVIDVGVTSQSCKSTKTKETIHVSITSVLLASQSTLCA